MSSANCDKCECCVGSGIFATYVIYSGGLSEEPCGAPLSIFINGDDWLSIIKYVNLSFRKLYMNLIIIVGKLYFISVYISPLCHSLSNAFSTSMNSAAQWCLRFLAWYAICVSWKILSCVLLFALKPACSGFIILFCSMYREYLLLIIFSSTLPIQLISAMRR